MLEHLHGHLARDRREAFEKLFEGIVVFEVIEERLDRDAGPREDRRAAENFGIDGNESRELMEPPYLSYASA